MCIRDRYQCKVKAVTLTEMITSNIICHYLVSVVVTSHNIFLSSKFQKTLSRNYSEIVIMYSRADRLSLRTLSQQTFPDSPKILMKAMTWVEKHVKGYLKYVMLDLSPITHLPGNYYMI